MGSTLSIEKPYGLPNTPWTRPPYLCWSRRWIVFDHMRAATEKSTWSPRSQEATTYRIYQSQSTNQQTSWPCARDLMVTRLWAWCPIWEPSQLRTPPPKSRLTPTAQDSHQDKMWPSCFLAKHMWLIQAETSMWTSARMEGLGCTIPLEAWTEVLIFVGITLKHRKPRQQLRKLPPALEFLRLVCRGRWEHWSSRLHWPCPAFSFNSLDRQSFFFDHFHVLRINSRWFLQWFYYRQYIPYIWFYHFHDTSRGLQRKIGDILIH